MDTETRLGGRGRFGVTRDSDGSLASIHLWPWYWRYPIVAAGLVALWFLVIVGAAKYPQWVQMTCLGLGALVVLSVTYELLALLLFAAFVWGASLLLEWLLPKSWVAASSWQATLAYFLVSGLVIYVLGQIKDLKSGLRNAELRIAQMQERLDRSFIQQHRSDDLPFGDFDE